MDLQKGINRARQLANLKGKKDTEFFNEVVNWLEELQEFRNGVKNGKPINGMKDTQLYHVYYGMKSRCYNAAYSNYKYYGGRGIKICPEWLGKDGFWNFYNWAIRNGYAENLTIDRIDVNGDYTPDNCRWVTWEVQAKNKRTKEKIYNIKGKPLSLTYKNTTLTITEWSKRTGLSYQVIVNRLKKGWSIEETLETPIDKTKRNRGQGRKQKNVS